MPLKDLPGFYFDPEKNRYFPIKGPIPGGALKRPTTSATSTSQHVGQENQVSRSQRRRRTKASVLVQLRELHGRFVCSKNRRLDFAQACQDVQASYPMVWMYPNSSNIADSALEQFSVVVQTQDGQKNTNILSMGSASGAIRCHEVGNVSWDIEHGCYNMPVPVWPSNKETEGSNILPTRLCSLTGASASFPCSVSSIKKIGRHSLRPTEDCSLPQNGLVSTLGCGNTGGSVYVLNLSEPLDFSSTDLALQRRILKVASFDCTLWTAVCSPNGAQAAIGTNKGAALVNLETGRFSWIFRCQSAIFSQQFDNLGNIVFCGLRNGSIIPVDIRQKQQHVEISSHQGQRIQTTREHPRYGKKPRKNETEFRASSSRSNGNLMPSAVCSLVSLSFDDRYFLGSSMDGSIKLFDCRLLQRGAVQSYKGHVNSHTHLQLGVNPSETQFLSGGEDSYMRIWNIKTAELLFAERFSSSVHGTVCWPQNGLEVSYKRQHFDGRPQMIDQSWGAWLGSREGVYYMHGT